MKKINVLIITLLLSTLWIGGCSNAKKCPHKVDSEKRIDSQEIDIFAAAEKKLALLTAEYEAQKSILQPKFDDWEARKKFDPIKKVQPGFKVPHKPMPNDYITYPQTLARGRKAKVQDDDEKAVGGMRYEVEAPVHLYVPGKYKVWFRYYRTENMHSNIIIRVVAKNSETIRFERFDWRIVNTAIPYEAEKFTRKGNEFVWGSIDFNIEYAGDYTIALNLDNLFIPKKPLFAITNVFVSNDEKFHPEKNKILATPKQDVVHSYNGFKSATIHAPNTNLNTSIKAHNQRMKTALHHCRSSFLDDAYSIQLGSVSGAWLTSDARKFNMPKQFDPNFTEKGYCPWLFNDKYPLTWKREKGKKAILTSGPERRVFSDGSFSTAYSYSSEAYRETCRKNAIASLKELENSPDKDLYSMLYTHWEICGAFDYSEISINAYHKFLEEKYGSLNKLNSAWHTDYKNIKDIFPAKFADCVGNKKIADPLKRTQEIANFIDFRDFCSKKFAQHFALKTQINLEYGGNRDIMANLSANNISSVVWMQWRPLSFEDTCQITLKGAKYVGYDCYGTNDIQGANFDTLDAFSEAKLNPILHEGSTHAPCEMLMSRSIWTLIGKGMKGLNLFTTQEVGAGELQKFGMSDMFDNASPRPKLAAVSDIYRAMHHLENLLTKTKRVHTSKPVAIYYSATNATLTERPAASIFDPGPDNYFRVYELIRGTGYPVTFITDRQIREQGEWLNGVQAIFFIDAKYIPLDVVANVKKWVNNGGHIVCDAQPGIYDGHGFPANSMAEFLGIAPVQKQSLEANAAEKLAFGYSAFSFDVVPQDSLYVTATEWKTQYDSQHPIAKEAGKIMLSGYGSQNVKCVAGEVLISQNNGPPAWIIREHGDKKGTSSYFAGFLGTLYGAGCTVYEWRDSSADSSPYRFIDAYLNYIGAKKVGFSDQAKDVDFGMRYESPLVDDKGNAVLPMINYNKHKLNDFNARYNLPKNVKEPKRVLALTNGNRKVEDIDYRYDAKNHTIDFAMKGFNAYGNVILANDTKPMLSVEFIKAKRDAYELADLRPSDELTAKVKVLNLSPEKLAKGKITLRLPDGWFYSKESVNVGAIKPYGNSKEFIFKIKTPAFNASRRLRPINFIYTNNDSISSSPAVEMVWFQTAPLNSISPIKVK